MRRGRPPPAVRTCPDRRPDPTPDGQGIVHPMLAGRRFRFAVEGAVFARVLHRFLGPVDPMARPR